MSKKEVEKKVLTYDIRPPEAGGIKRFNRVPEKEILKGMQRFRRLGGESFYVRKLNPETSEYEIYKVIPDKADVTPVMVAEVVDHPYPKLAALKLTLGQKIKQWLPFVFVGLGLLAMVLAGGINGQRRTR